MCNLVTKWSTVKVLDCLYEIARKDRTENRKGVISTRRHRVDLLLHKMGRGEKCYMGIMRCLELQTVE